MQVGARIVPARGTGAVLVQRARIVGMARVLEVDLSAPGPGLPGPAGARGQHAIHHVDAALHRTDDVVGLADAHQVARLVLGQHRGRVVEHAEHRLLPLPDREAADRVAVEADGLQRLGALAAQRLGHAALLDAEERMARPVAEGLARTGRPPHRQAHRLGHAGLVGRKRRAFVEAHHDVRAEQALDLHRGLGAEEMLRTVDMRAEGHAVLGQLAQVCKAHHLEAARVGEDRLVPVHEAVQPAQPVDPFRTGAQHQVIGVAQQDVGAGGGHAFGHHRLHRGGGADGHEGGGADLAARRPDHARAGRAVGGVQRKGKGGGHATAFSAILAAAQTIPAGDPACCRGLRRLRGSACPRRAASACRRPRIPGRASSAAGRRPRSCRASSPRRSSCRSG